jgi:chaperonin cofactor prefoldin
MPETNNIRSLDTDVRVSVLETQVTSISSSMEKLEEKIDTNYATLHHMIYIKTLNQNMINS